MINYIKAELYRNFNRRYLWAYTLSIVLFPLILSIIIKVGVSTDIMNLSVLLKLSLNMLILPVFLVIGMVDMVLCEEYKNGTLKNAVSFGISRTRIVVSKLISAVILAFVSAFIILTILFGSCAILLGLGSDINSVFIDTFTRIGAAVPLWIGAISIGIFLNMLITNSNVFSFVYVGIFIIVPQVFKLLSVFASDKFDYLYNIFPTVQVGRLGQETIIKGQIIEAITLGCLYTIVFLIFSIVCFKNKEIK